MSGGGTKSAFDAAGGGALSRLTDHDKLDACLAAVRTIHPGQPDVVDFARFSDRPALIVHFASPPSIVAVGPNCGVTGPDLLYATPPR